MSSSHAPRAPRDSIGAQTGRLYELEGRRKKAAKILAALSQVLPDTAQRRMLDAGCASGIITQALAPNFGFAVGVDADETGIRMGDSGPSNPTNHATIMRASTAALPFPDSAFDVVICTQVYEHVANQQALADELFRVVKPGGWCFFSGPNRLWPIEDHYKLPFLGWLPRVWANVYLRLLGRGDAFEENLLTLRQLRQLFSRFERVDVTAKMIRNPDAFNIETSAATAIAARLPESLIHRLEWVYPNFNWMLRKPDGVPATRQIERV